MNPQTPFEWIAAIVFALAIVILFLAFARQRPMCYRCGRHPATHEWKHEVLCESCYFDIRHGL